MSKPREFWTDGIGIVIYRHEPGDYEIKRFGLFKAREIVDDDPRLVRLDKSQLKKVIFKDGSESNFED